MCKRIVAWHSVAPSICGSPGACSYCWALGGGRGDCLARHALDAHNDVRPRRPCGREERLPPRESVAEVSWRTQALCLAQWHLRMLECVCMFVRRKHVEFLRYPLTFRFSIVQRCAAGSQSYLEDVCTSTLSTYKCVVVCSMMIVDVMYCRRRYFKVSKSALLQRCSWW